MKVKVPVWDALAGLAGPHPLLAFHSGVLIWRPRWEDQGGVPFWRPNMAFQMGGPKWRFILASQYGVSIGRTKVAFHFKQAKLTNPFSGF
jgi:hypothetical protein